MALLRIIAVIFALNVSVLGGAVALPLKTLPPAQLMEDFSVLKTALEGAHAGLYRYSSNEEIDAEFAAVEQQLGTPKTDLEFFRVLTPLIDAIHDGHTNIRPSRELRGHLLEADALFPFDVRYQRGRPFVEVNFSDEQDIIPGTELLSINGQSTEDVTEILLRATGVDGHSKASKYYSLNRLFWLYYAENISAAGTFETAFKNPKTGEINQRTIAGISASKHLTRMRSEGPKDNLTLQIEEGGLAIMTIASLLDLDAAAFFENSFKEIKNKKVKNLIIDIRGNGGGYDKFNTDLFSYLSDRPFRFYDGFTTRITDASVISWNGLDDDSYFFAPELLTMTEVERQNFVAARSRLDLIKEYITRNPAAGIHMPDKKYRYKGDVYLLFDGGSGSSGGEIPALMHHLGIGTLIGEEANGGYEGVTAGIMVPLELPNSGIRLGVPLIAYHNAVVDGVLSGRSAPPDFPVTQTLDDALKGVDTAMEFTRDLIRKRNP